MTRSVTVGAGNNLLYRARGGEHDLAIKLAIRDGRDRAGREYAALLALQRAGMPIAPSPLWLDRDSYAQPVVVQSWLAGDVLATPPADDREWQRLLDHYEVPRGGDQRLVARPEGWQADIRAKYRWYLGMAQAEQLCPTLDQS